MMLMVNWSMPILQRCMLYSKSKDELGLEPGWNVSRRVPVLPQRYCTVHCSVSPFTLVNNGLEVSLPVFRKFRLLTRSQLLHVLWSPIIRTSWYRGSSPDSTHIGSCKCRHDFLRSIRCREIRSSMAPVHRCSLASNLVTHLCCCCSRSSTNRERSGWNHVDCRYLPLYRFLRGDMGSYGLGGNWRDLPSEDSSEASVSGYSRKLAW